MSEGNDRKKTVVEDVVDHDSPRPPDRLMAGERTTGEPTWDRIPNDGEPTQPPDDGTSAGLGGRLPKTGLVKAVIVVLFLLLIGWFVVPRVIGTKGSSFRYMKTVARHMPEDTAIVGAVRSPLAAYLDLRSYFRETDLKIWGEMALFEFSDPLDQFIKSDEDSDGPKFGLNTFADAGISMWKPVGFGLSFRQNDRGYEDEFVVMTFGAKGGRGAPERFIDFVASHGDLFLGSLEEDDIIRFEIDGRPAVQADGWSTFTVTSDGGRLVVLVTDSSDLEGDRELLEDLIANDKADSLAGTDEFKEAVGRRLPSVAAIVGLFDHIEDGDLFLPDDVKPFGIQTFDIDGGDLHTRSEIQLEDDHEFLDLIDNKNLRHNGFKVAPGPASILVAATINSDAVESLSDVWLGASGEWDYDRFVRDMKNETSLDLPDLLDALDGEFGLVMGDVDLNPDRILFGNGATEAIAETLLFASVDQSDDAFDELEDFTDRTYPRENWESEGDGEMFMIDRDYGVAIGLDDDFVWFGGDNRVEDGLERDSRTVRSESKQLLNALPKRGFVSLAVDVPELMPYDLDDMMREFDFVSDDLLDELPKWEDLFGALAARMFVDGDRIVFEASLDVNARQVRRAVRQISEGVYEEHREYQTYELCRSLERRVQSYRGFTGNYPDRLSEAMREFGPVSNNFEMEPEIQGTPVDSWDKSVRLEFTERGDPTVCSAGTDGEFGTDDDICSRS